MSYILDALKKSDQERQENQGPTLQTIQRPQRAFRNNNTRLLLILMVFILLLFLAVAVTWFYMSSNLTSEEGKEEVFSNKSNHASSIAEDSADQVQTDKNNAVDFKGEKVTETNTIKENVIYLVPTVKFWELPDHIQQEIPPLTFSFHVFSANAERRTIIINKHRMTEGDVVLPDLILEEITEKGVVLIWKSKYRFTIDVVENW